MIGVAPLAPRHSDATQAPAVACQHPLDCLERHTDGSARDFALSPCLGFAFCRLFVRQTSSVLPLAFLQGHKERIMPILNLFRQPEISTGVVEEVLNRLRIKITDGGPKKVLHVAGSTAVVDHLQTGRQALVTHAAHEEQDQLDLCARPSTRDLCTHLVRLSSQLAGPHPSVYRRRKV